MLGLPLIPSNSSRHSRITQWTCHHVKKCPPHCMVVNMASRYWVVPGEIQILGWISFITEIGNFFSLLGSCQSSQDWITEGWRYLVKLFSGSTVIEVLSWAWVYGVNQSITWDLQKRNPLLPYEALPLSLIFIHRLISED